MRSPIRFIWRRSAPAWRPRRTPHRRRTAKPQHGANCCGFCGVGHGGAVAVDPPPLIFVVLQRQYRLIAWLEATDHDAAGTRRLARAGARATLHFLTSLDLRQMVRPAAVPVRTVEQAGQRAGVRIIPCFVLHHPSGSCAARCWHRLPSSYRPSTPRRRPDRQSLPPVTVTAPEQKRATGARPPRSAARSARAVQAGARSGAADRRRSGAGRSRRAGGAERAAGADRDQQHPGRRRARAGRGLQEFDRRQHHQGHPRLRAGRLRAAEMGRRHAAFDPRLRPVAQFPSARRPALHGRHSDQHRRRLRRFPGDRPDRLQICRGLQGRQRAAVRRQLARRRHQFRDADRPRSVAERRVGRYGRIRIQAAAGQCRRRQRSMGRFRHRLHPGVRTAFRDHSFGSSHPRQRQCRLSVLAGCRDAVLFQRQRDPPAHPRQRHQAIGADRSPSRRAGKRRQRLAAQHRYRAASPTRPRSGSTTPRSNSAPSASTAI